MSHTHRAASISVTGKTGEVLIICDCGKEEIIGLWYIHPLKGWSKRQWKSLMKAACHFVYSWNKTGFLREP